MRQALHRVVLGSVVGDDPPESALQVLIHNSTGDSHMQIDLMRDRGRVRREEVRVAPGFAAATPFDGQEPTQLWQITLTIERAWAPQIVQDGEIRQDSAA